MTTNTDTQTTGHVEVTRDDDFEEGVVSLYRFDSLEDRDRAKEAVAVALHRHRIAASPPHPIGHGEREGTPDGNDGEDCLNAKRGHPILEGDKRIVALALTPTGSAEPSTKWASPALDRAYWIVEQLRDDLAQHPESGIDESLRRALEAIETADCELVGVAS